MSSNYTYLLVDLGCLLVPFLFSFHPAIRFDREWKYFALPSFITSLLFIAWDMVFTAKGVWGFNPDYVLGVYIYNLPLEEVLFFLCIPYACVFTYFCMRKMAPSLRTKNFSIGTLLIATVLVVLALLNHERAYTFAALGICGTMLIVAWFALREYLALFFVSYLLVMPFFLLSNGILTGSFIAEPVVWYNDAENTAQRIFTIPVEDVFYGMLLILMNVLGYEWLRGQTFKVSKTLKV